MSKPITTLVGHNKSGFGTAHKYAGAVPLESARNFLASGDSHALPVYARLPDGTMIEAPNQRAITRKSNNHVHGVMSSKYAIHQHTELLDGVAHILGDTTGGNRLSLSAVGMQDDGATAWLSVGLADSAITASGVEFDTYLLAYGSMNGKYATTFVLTSTLAICNNAISLATKTGSSKVKVRHTSLSLARLTSAREALGIVLEERDALDLEIQRLCEETVTAQQWTKALNLLAPMPEDGETGRGRTMKENKRDALAACYASDKRNLWKGSKFGIVQAVSLYGHWFAPGTGTGDQYERNMTRRINGDAAKLDAYAVQVADLVCAE